MDNLLIGASGLLGRNLSFPGSTLTPSSTELNILNISSVSAYFYKHKYIDKIILSAAYTNVPRANLDKQAAFNLNVVGVYNILHVISRFTYYKPTLFYISTDYVFDGDTGGYKTTDPVNPVKNNYYAMTKALGESAARSYDKTSIIRTSFCQSGPWPHGFAFDDQFTSRDTVDIIAPMISSIVNKNTIGIHHIGTERKSVFDLAKRLSPNVKPISRLSIQNVNIPWDTSLT